MGTFDEKKNGGGKSPATVPLRTVVSGLLNAPVRVSRLYPVSNQLRMLMVFVQTLTRTRKLGAGSIGFSISDLRNSDFWLKNNNTKAYWPHFTVIIDTKISMYVIIIKVDNIGFTML